MNFFVVVVFLNINFQKYFFISHSYVPYHIFSALLIVDVSHYVLFCLMENVQNFIIEIQEILKETQEKN
jgi:hypothetical protein